MSVVALPAECIYQIAKYLDFIGITNLLLSCKRLNQILEDFQVIPHIKSNGIYGNLNLLNLLYTYSCFEELVFPITKDVTYTQISKAMNQKVIRFDDMESFYRNYYSLKHVPGIENTFRSLLKSYNPHNDNNFAVQWAAINGHSKILGLLLKDPRVDPSISQNYCLRYSSCNGHIRCVKLLLTDPRVCPRACNDFAIKYAAFEGHHEIVEELMRDMRVTNTYF